MSDHPTRPSARLPEGSPAAGAAGPVGPLERGRVVGGRYRLDEPLASGGMATVWRAVDTVLTRPVAVKVLHADLAADPEFVARFRREAIAAARLTHPAIVATYDTCDDPEAIVMELVPGRTLRDELDVRGFLPPAEAVAVASTVCQALDVAHRAGIVHRDVKPANVLLTADGRCKVADFGVAKAARGAGDDDLPDLTAVGRMVGTAKYLAPEQVRGGDVDARADVYAVGAVLYEMLCGRPPFEGDNDLATATARLTAMPERPRAVLRTVPTELDSIVMRALATDPEDRHPSAASLWADLQRCATEGDEVLATVDVAADATVVGDAPSFARAERSWLVPAAVVSIVAIALGLAWALIGGTEARRELFDLVERVAPGGGDGRADPEPVAVVGIAAFDPAGDGREHDDEAPLAVDGDLATAWTTERYDSRAFGELKPGVGLVLTLERAVDVSEVRITSPDRGWAATVHVASDAAPTRSGWGEPSGAVSSAGEGRTEVDVVGSGDRLLVWVTDLGDDPGVTLELAEIVVLGT